MDYSFNNMKDILKNKNSYEYKKLLEVINRYFNIDYDNKYLFHIIPIIYMTFITSGILVFLYKVIH